MIQLTEEVFNHFAENQEKLDEFIREKKGISLDDWDKDNFYRKAHNLALRIELHEFMNECRDVWKYWKDKPVDYEKLKDELVDVIHFIHLILNKVLRTDSLSNRREMREKINLFAKNMSHKHSSVELLNLLSSEDYLLKTYAILLTIAHQVYGMSLEEIVEAYDIKNAENYKRQQTGW